VSRPAVQFRRTRDADVAQLPDIERAAGRLFQTIDHLAWLVDDADVWDEDEHRDFAAQGTSWVADAGSRAVGFVVGERFDDELHVWELSVAPEWQGRGLGRGLMHILADDVARVGMAAVTLTTFINVPWNRPFYESLGFRPLDGCALSPRLRDVLGQEADAGLPMAERCAMRLVL